ncbi:MAG: transcriptional repressor [Acetobacteraceae bacterium]|nr:transcriptional repressor [Acetobacteraceae bacterium]MSP30868.1 transcriptional repressor [Acetobacteraceae bacterium]
MGKSSFPAATEALLDRAEAICAGKSGRLTPLRREVLGLVLDSTAPTGAYDLLEKLRQTRHRAAPPTVYRALDFLLEHGLIHRLERLSAFIGCVAHEHAEDGHVHAAQFLICRNCRKVTEIEDGELAHALAHVASRLGFTVAGATIEAEGLCAACQQSD